MEDEKNQNDSMIKKVGDKLKKGAKDQAKAAMKKVFKKIIAALAPILLKLFIILVIIIVLVETFSWLLELFKGSSSTDASKAAIQYAYASVTEGEGGEDDKTGYRVFVKPDTSKKAYVLEFRFNDKYGDSVPETRVITKIKEELTSAGLNPEAFTESELKIIAALEYNGLSVDEYTEDELKCTIIFMKAEIASQNFDLRDKAHIGETVSIDEIRGNDYVYGTLQVQKTSATDSGYKTDTLEFLEYGNSETPGTFAYLVKNNDESVVNYFSLDNAGNLLCAKKSTTTTTVSYLDESGNALSEDEIEKIPEGNKETPINTSTVSETTPLAYKQYITKFTMNYGLLNNLTIVTQNPNFGIDLAKLAFNNKIIINLKEDTTQRETDTEKTYTDTKIIQDYVDYTVSGTSQTEESSSTWSYLENGQANNLSMINPSTDCGWNSEDRTNISNESDEDGQHFYWTYNGNNYKLDYRRIPGERPNNRTWSLYIEQTTTSSGTTQYPTETGNELIVKGNEEGVGDYTQKDTWTYKVKTVTNVTSHTYKFEISEIDTWFAKYKKSYDDRTSTSDTFTSSDEAETEGEFTQEPTESITDESVINGNSFVTEFKNTKINEYKNRNSGVENVEFKVNELKVDTWLKTDSKTKTTTNSVKYKFSDDEADITQIEYKIDKDTSGNYDERSFLYIYDKYVKETDLFLKDDAESQLYELLEDNNDTVAYSNLIKYLLFTYDGLDRGVTDLDQLIGIFKIEEFKTARIMGSAIAEWLRSYEFEPLREYRNGDKQYEQWLIENNYIRINSEGKVEYAIYELDVSGDHSLNFSYGLRVYGYEDNTTAANYIALFEDEGINLESIVNAYLSGDNNNIWVDADIVDKIQLKVINDKVEQTKQFFNDAGLEITRNQVDALVAVSYNYGNYGGSSTRDAFARYGVTEEFRSTAATAGGSQFFVEGPRHAELWLMFSENRYILSTGEEIDSKLFYGVGQGGITTQEEADNLTEQFSEMLNVPGTFRSDPSYSLSFDVYNNLPEEFKRISRKPGTGGNLEMFQCTWWANGRANLYLAENGTKYTSYPTLSGHGGAYYRINQENGWFEYGPNPRPNSIGSYGNGVDGDYGHVFYVEGVTDDGIWISDCGGGTKWLGVRFWTNSEWESMGIHGFIYLDEPK